MIDAQIDPSTLIVPQLPPQNLDAEKGVLGSILLVSAVYDDVADVLEPEHFYLHAHQQIFTAIREMRAKGDSGIDPVTLAALLDSRGQLEEIGGIDTLVNILASVPHAAHVKYYATIVREKWMLRNLIYSCTDTLHDCYKEHKDAGEILQAAERRVLALGAYSQPEAKIHIGEILPDVLDLITERMNSKVGPGVNTHFVDIDKKLNGMRPSELIILAARPGCGKTSFAANVALNLARTGKGVMFFSLEQSRTELAERYLCLSSGIHGDVIRKGTLDEVERDLLMVTAGELSPLPLLIDDAPGRSVSQIASICRRHKAKYNLGLIVVDYLQLIEPEDKRAPREQQVAQMTRRLKCLAKEIGLPIMVLAQLNRAVEARDNKTPRLSDLRESGAIEQDADIVLFISRPELYTEADRPGEADVTIAKNRAGPTGTVVLTFRKETMQFFDHAPAAAYAGRFEPSSYPSVDF